MILPNFWRYERIRDILRDETYTGVLYYDKSHKNKKLPKSEWKLSSHRHEAIIYKYEFELAQQKLQQISDRKVLTQQKTENHIYLLSSLLKCDHCKRESNHLEPDMMTWSGVRDKIGSNPDRYSYKYQCNRKNSKKFSFVCPVVAIPAVPLEEYVINFVKQLLSNPKAVYDYQKQLESTKKATEQLKKVKKHREGLLNALPQRHQNLKDQHEEGVIKTPELKQKLDELALKEKEYKDKIDEIDFQLSQVMLSKGYEASLQLYSERYSRSLESIMKDREQMYEVISGLISQITVYSRPINENDVIAGRKKENQMIPDRIDIFLNLPQNLLRQLYTQKFAVRSDDLWALRDSNP